MKWLITAFEPFDSATTNSSLVALSALERLEWQDQLQFLYPIPVTFSGAWPAVLNSIPSDIGGVLALGQAEGRSRIGLERVALNFQDARIKDNAGASPRECAVIEGAPDMLWTTIPWKNFPLPASCELSYSAGTFVCNTLMYHIVDWARKHGKHGGFIHVPLLESQAESNSLHTHLPDEEVVKSLAEALRFLIRL